ncbi:MAG: hypothetical protein KBD19_04125 [Candidatus Moranbacteria bacterium]|nr:hypothetical protein [Candidatus Moranbacteria bacterium]
MRVTVFGNPDLEIDNLPIRLLPRLREAFPDVEFEVEDPNNLDLPDIPPGEEWIIMDTVAGIPDVCWLSVEDIAKPLGRLTAHDYDLASYLLLAKKALGPLPIRILGIPMGMAEDATAIQVIDNLQKMLYYKPI